MKKTLITLLALAGVVNAETYYYVGGEWAEVETNWQSESGANPKENTNGWTDTGTGNTFIIGDGKTAKSGSNMTFANTTLEIQDGGKLTVEDPTTFKNTTVEIQNGGAVTVSAEAKFNGVTIDIADGGVFTTSNSGGGIKLKDTTINTNSALSLHRLTFNNDSNMGDITFNLDKEGKISVANTYVMSGYTSSITLSAILQDGYLSGSGDIVLEERVLVDFGTRVTSNGTGDELSALLSRVKGGTFTLNGEALTLGTFDAAALTAGDVGKYKLVMDGSAVKVQYAAYSVPEPTTATLSLLALAGLAARRRRK